MSKFQNIIKKISEGVMEEEELSYLIADQNAAELSQLFLAAIHSKKLEFVKIIHKHVNFNLDLIAAEAFLDSAKIGSLTAMKFIWENSVPEKQKQLLELKYMDKTSIPQIEYDYIAFLFAVSTGSLDMMAWLRQKAEILCVANEMIHSNDNKAILYAAVLPEIDAMVFLAKHTPDATQYMQMVNNAKLAEIILTTNNIVLIDCVLTHAEKASDRVILFNNLLNMDNEISDQSERDYLGSIAENYQIMHKYNIDFTELSNFTERVSMLATIITRKKDHRLDAERQDYLTPELKILYQVVEKNIDKDISKEELYQQFCQAKIDNREKSRSGSFVEAVIASRAESIVLLR